jgi:hypothetical protein
MKEIKILSEKITRAKHRESLKQGSKDMAKIKIIPDNYVCEMEDNFKKYLNVPPPLLNHIRKTNGLSE